MANNAVEIENKTTSKEFDIFFKKKIVRYLAKIENLRKKCLMWIYIELIAFLIIDGFIITFLYINEILFEKNNLKLVGFLLILPFIIMEIISKCGFKNKAKDIVLEKVMSFIGNFKINKDKEDRSYIESLKLFKRFNRFDCDDRLTGKYNKLNMDIQELKLSYKAGKSETMIFQGIFIKVPSLKKYQGITVVSDSGNTIWDTPIFPNFGKKEENLEKVVLEDPEFNKLYHVESTNQIEARFLLTTAFMDRMVKLSKKGYGKALKLSFEQGNINLALSSSKDWFEVPIMKSALNPDNYRNIILEISALLKIIDSLNLESDIGL